MNRLDDFQDAQEEHHHRHDAAAAAAMALRRQGHHHHEPPFFQMMPAHQPQHMIVNVPVPPIGAGTWAAKVIGVCEALKQVLIVFILLLVIGGFYVQPFFLRMDSGLDMMGKLNSNLYELRLVMKQK